MSLPPDTSQGIANALGYLQHHLHELTERQNVSCPPDFGRERHNGHMFLNSCSLYIRLAPEQFHDEKEKILWALMFFKSGRAAKWSENVFRQKADTSILSIRT